MENLITDIWVSGIPMLFFDQVNDGQINRWLNLFNVKTLIPATALAAFSLTNAKFDNVAKLNFKHKIQNQNTKWSRKGKFEKF